MNSSLIAPDLPEILEDLWMRLAQATTDPREPFRLPALCTIDQRGWPTSRTVVLQRTDSTARTLECHTDLRSEKVRELERDQRCSWLFHDPRVRLQLRAAGTIALHQNDDLSESRWHGLGDRGRGLYFAPRAPGTPGERPDTNFPDLAADPSIVARWRERFCVLVCQVEQIDWYHIRPEGHLRARFTWSSTGELAMTWLAP